MSVQLRDRAESDTGGAEEPGQAPNTSAADARAPANEGRRPRRLLATLGPVHRCVKEIEPWGVLLAVGALFLSLTAFRIDYRDRVEERTVRAWQLLTTRAAGNSGKIAALEYLNKEDGFWCDDDGCLITLRNRTPFVGIDLSGSGQEGGSVFLREVDLARADLSEANLSEADLFRANLRGADLFRTNLSRANLTQADLILAELTNADLILANLSYADLTDATLVDADLTGAFLANASLVGGRFILANLTGTYMADADLSDTDLSNTNMTGAILLRANLSRAILKNANLRNADLSEANLNQVRELTQKQLDEACGSGGTQLPSGLTIRLCESIPAARHHRYHAAGEHTTGPVRAGAE